MQTYQTSEVAKIIGIHPNTVRLYEQLQLIPEAERRDNRYRVFTELHVAQLRLARLAFQVEAVQNGLRKKIVELVKASATGDYDRAIALTSDYLSQVRQEQLNAKEAIQLVRQLLSGRPAEGGPARKRKEVSALLGLSMDTLRSWEMNGLLDVKRRENGYRVYTGEDIRRLKIIRSLRCANFSLEAILRLLHALSVNPDADIDQALDMPRTDDGIISVCDTLIHSLQAAEQNALAMLDMLKQMKAQFG